MERLFVDTSAWFAYANRTDPDHGKVSPLIRSFQGRLVTSNFVFDETVTLCLYRLGHQSAKAVGEVLLNDNSIDLVRLTARDERDGWKLFLERSDKEYSFTDCTSFALMRRLGIATALTLDDDFQREGFTMQPRI